MLSSKLRDEGNVRVEYRGNGERGETASLLEVKCKHSNFELAMEGIHQS
jgi:hypothetical protein